MGLIALVVTALIIYVLYLVLLKQVYDIIQLKLKYGDKIKVKYFPFMGIGYFIK
jgi:hypothetical protein